MVSEKNPCPLGQGVCQWIKNYRLHTSEGYRCGQHICNWFKLSRMEGDNKKFEELLWEIKDLTGVLEALEYYNIIDYNN